MLLEERKESFPREKKKKERPPLVWDGANDLIVAVDLLGRPLEWLLGKQPCRERLPGKDGVKKKKSSRLSAEIGYKIKMKGSSEISLLRSNLVKRAISGYQTSDSEITHACDLHKGGVTTCLWRNSNISWK